MRDKYVWYFASFLGVIFIKKAFYTENPYDEEASIKLWKSLDSGTSKSHYGTQERKKILFQIAEN